MYVHVVFFCRSRINTIIQAIDTPQQTVKPTGTGKEDLKVK